MMFNGQRINVDQTPMLEGVPPLDKHMTVEAFLQLCDLLELGMKQCDELLGLVGSEQPAQITTASTDPAATPLSPVLANWMTAA